MKSVQTNPFVIGAYAGSHYFCDRERETDELIQDLMNGRNVVLIAQRRMGKTGLILHTFHQEKISKHYNVFFIDIFATASIREFIYAFGNAIIDGIDGINHGDCTNICFNGDLAGVGFIAVLSSGGDRGFTISYRGDNAIGDGGNIIVG